MSTEHHTLRSITINRVIDLDEDEIRDLNKTGPSLTVEILGEPVDVKLKSLQVTVPQTIESEPLDVLIER